MSAVESSTASDVKVHKKCIPPGWQEIDACGLSTKELSDRLRSMTIDGATGFVLTNICGQRYIGTRLYLPSIDRKVEIEVHGTPGNDLGAFMSGHKITVHGNVQDGVGNTMDDGEITVEGRGGDVLGMSMRGGKIFVRDSVGYRTALHMKEYLDKKPVLVIGGTAQDFLGEYMAGGIVVLLGIGCTGHDAQFIGTGMHGGVIFLRGTVDRSQLGKEVEISTPTEDDLEFLDKMVAKFLGLFPMLSLSKDDIMKEEFVKLSPISKRPYGKLYAY